MTSSTAPPSDAPGTHLPRLLYSVAEAAEVLRVPEARLRRLMTGGVVPATRAPNGELRLARADLDVLIADGVPDVPQLLYRVEEAALMLTMGRSTLYRLVREGRVPYTETPHGERRLSMDDIQAIIADGRRPPTAAP